MNAQMISLNDLYPSPANPRRSIDDGGIAELAQSIKANGLLQNLVAIKRDGKQGYEIICGHRRFQALQSLLQAGELQQTAVPVEIKEGLSEEEILRIATIENVQREGLSPMDEAEAFLKLSEIGTDIDTVAAQTGKSVAYVRKRLVLAQLCDQAKKALREGKISLGAAEALTLGNHKEQRAVLKQIKDGHCTTVQHIKRILTGKKPCVSMAIFDFAEYKGDFTHDLFGEDENTYFNDLEQFFALQRKAAEALAAQYLENGAAFADIVNGHYLPWENYCRTGKPKTKGVVILFSETGEVEVEEGVFRKADQEKDKPKAKEEKKAKPAYSAPLCAYFAAHKSMAVQKALLANPRKVKEIAIVQMLKTGIAGVSLTAHECLWYLTDKKAQPESYQAVETEAQAALRLLGLEVKKGSAWAILLHNGFDALTIYETLKTFRDEEIEPIFTLLVALTFGQDSVRILDTKDSLFNRVACDLKVDMRSHWMPDEAFLSRRNISQLEAIAKESGAAKGLGIIGNYKKKDLVKALVKFFEKARTVKKPNEDEQKARDWLPEAMQFPAIDPDQKQKKKS